MGSVGPPHLVQVGVPVRIRLARGRRAAAIPPAAITGTGAIASTTAGTNGSVATASHT